MSDTETDGGGTRSPKTNAAHCNRYTSNSESLQELIEDFGSNISNADISVSSLKLMHSELKAQYDLFKKSWCSYEKTIINDTSQYGSVSREYRKLKRETLALLNQVSQMLDEKTSSQGQQTSQSNPPTLRQPMPKLAPIEIPKFDGDIAKFTAFWDIFNSLIHSRTDLEDVIKFTTLRSHLTGRAFKTVEGIAVTDANYKSVVALLKKQFGKEDRLITQLTLKLQNLSVVSHSYNDLLEFKLTFEKIILQLENIKPDYTKNAFFVESLINKLPVETFRLLAERYKGTEWSYRQFSDGLTDIIDLMERCQLQPSSKRKTDTVSQVTVESKSQSQNSAYFKKAAKSKKHNSVQSVKAVVANNQSSNTFTPSCVFCSQNHSSKYCSNYSTLDSRHNRVRELNLCFGCLKSGHHFSDCSKTRECRNCNSDKHHTFLCIQFCQKPQNPSRTVSSSATKPSGCSASQPQKSYTNVDNATSKTTPNTVVQRLNANSNMLPVSALPTATVQISGGGIRRVTRVFFDTGSQRTFIQKELAQELNLPVIDHIQLSLAAFDSEIKLLNCDVVKLQVRLGHTRLTLRAITHESVNTHIATPGLVCVADMLRSHNIKLADEYRSDVVTDVGLIVGADNYSKFNIRMHNCKNIQLLSCGAGSMIFGPLPQWATGSEETINASSIKVQYAFCSRITIVDSEIDQIPNLWKLDAVGIVSESYSPEENLTLEKFTKSLTYSEDTHQYSVDLPFRSESIRPPLNYYQAFGQLMSLRSAIERNPILFEEYNSIFLDYLSRGFIEPSSVQTAGHYLPYHGVRKESSTTPLRIVFNASSCQLPDGLSLNSCLLTGPSLTTKLFDYLVEFRINPYAVIADISKAFLRIGINEPYRDYTKFLWFKDSTLKEIAVFRFKVVLFGATCSPFLLQSTLVHHLQTHGNPLASSLIPHFYVDNFAYTYATLEQMFKEYPIINQILMDANMPLQSWVSNDTQFNSALQEDIPATDVNVLGLTWNFVSDTLSVKSGKHIQQYIECHKVNMRQQSLLTLVQLTKRKVVSLVSSVFDPLGLLSPLIIRAKIFIQKLWTLKCSWDSPLEAELCAEFFDICKNLVNISVVEFPRFVIVPHKCELHLFADASKQAYGFAVYSVNLDNQTSSLVLSKSRVAPVKELTIPKLELTAVNLASKLAEHLMENSNLSFTSCTIWSDSKVTISWIKYKRSTEVYVCNRVKEINEKNFLIYYVPTADNPADLLTRGISFKQFCSSDLWKFGPKWLTNPSQYPCQKDFEKCNIVINELLVEPFVAEPFVPCLDVSQYSSLQEVVRIFGIVLLFAKSFKRKNDIRLSPLHLLVKLVQQEQYPTLCHYLKTASQNNVSADIIHFANQLGLYLDNNGIIRTHSRLKNAEVKESVKYPILLPPKSPLTNLIIRQCHLANHHAGLNTVLVQLREEFWLPKARQQIKHVVYNCMHCRKLLRAPLSLPPAPPLPKERVIYNRPFQCSGVDMTGAYEVFDQDADEGICRRSKAYICLFTCTSTRAVHLELLSTLSKYEFVLAFRRFCALYSVPQLIISDHGSNFRGCDNFLKRIQDEPEVQNHLKGVNIKWKFITPRSPWQGGFYERLIGVVKSSLNKSIANRKLSFVELQTVVCEIATLVNSRPLTYLSDSTDGEVLTPNHMIFGRNVVIAPPLNEFGDDVPYLESDDLRAQYAQLSSLLKKFEKHWTELYLTSLRERHYGNNPTASQICPLKIGDLVLVDLENNHRNLWPMGKIVNLFSGRDGQIRSVRVEINGTLYERTLNKVVPLELTVTERDVAQEQANRAEALPRRNPTRKAALAAHAERKFLIDENLL